MPKHSPTTRGLLNSHPGVGAGKGSADRSPGWREHYDEINWGPDHGHVGHFHKTYGPPKQCIANPENLCTCNNPDV